MDKERGENMRKLCGVGGGGGSLGFKMVDLSGVIELLELGY